MDELFKLNEKGLYDFVGTNEDILECMQSEWDADYIYNIKQYDDEFLMFYTGENKYKEIDTEFHQLEDDIVYVDGDGRRYNLSCGDIIFFKIKNLKHPTEYFYAIPKAFENLDVFVFEYFEINDESLFEMARTIGNTFITKEELFEIAMKHVYGEDHSFYWSRHTFDDYIKDLEDNYLEEMAFSHMSDEDIKRYL